MPAYLDRTAERNGKPGLHAFIVGVSSYPYLRNGANAIADDWQMEQLTASVRSAVSVYDFLRDADDKGLLLVPLTTCQLLLSPSAAEIPAVPAGANPASVARFIVAANEWREACKTHRDNVALFYFAGHGVQRTTEDAVLCLEDFREPPFPPLTRSVALANLRGGMSPAPQFPEIARTQLYFVDACRDRPTPLSEFEAMGTADVFPVSLAGQDDRCSPIYYASISNRTANAVPHQGSLFSRALLDSLKGEAGQALEETDHGTVPWGVTVNSLSEYLDSRKIDALNREFQADQTYASGGQFRERVICLLSEPPPVDFSIEILPPEASQDARIRLWRAGASPAIDARPIAPNPLHCPGLPGGIYRLEISFDPGHPVYRGLERDYDLRPVRVTKRVRVD